MSLNDRRTSRRVDVLRSMLDRFVGAMPTKRAVRARQIVRRACYVPERLEERLVFSPLITLGTYNLLPNTPNQKINVYVGGGDAVEAVDFELMTGDSGPALIGSVLAPQITGVDLLATGVQAPNNSGTLVATNTLFSASNTSTGGSGQLAGGQYFDISTTTNAGVGNGTLALAGTSMDPVSGRTGQALLAVVTIDTTGFFGNASYNLSVDGSVNNGPVLTGDPTDFPLEGTDPVNHYAGFTDGTLNVGSATASRTIVAAASGTYGATSANLTANVSVPGGPATPATEGTVTFTVLNANKQQVGSPVMGTVGANGVATAPFSLAGLNAGSYTVTATYADAGGVYSSNTGSPAKLTVNKAALSVTATANSKTYGQTASESGNVSGAQNGDVITATFSSAGDAKTANVNSYAITDVLSDGGTGKLANYTVNFTGANLVVSKATLTVAANANDKAYGMVASDSGSVMGVQNSDPITATFSSTGDAATANVNTYAITDLLSDAGTGKLNNYSVNFTGANLIVNKATLSVTATANSKTYGQTSTDHGTVNGVLNSDPITATFSSSGDTAGASVNTYAITDLLSDAGTGKLNNYSVNFTGANLVVNKATLTITASANDKAYGQTATDHGTVNGVQNSDPITATFSSTGDAATASVSTYPITDLLSDAGTGKLSNYSVNFTGANLVVNKATLSVTATANSKTYGQAVSDSGTVNGVVNGDPITATFSSTGDAAAANVNTYAITDLLSDAGTGQLSNYTVNFTGANLVVSKAALTVTATANSKSYGQTASDSGNVGGALNGDPITATFSSTGDAATANVNSYAITDLLSDAGTGKLSNYSVNFTGANLVVNKTTLTVTATANAKNFGQVAIDHGTVAGVVNSDPITATFSSAGDPASAVAGVYPITDTLSDAGTGKLANYSVNFTGANLTVTGSANTVASPTFSVPAGTYTSSTTVTISDTTAGSTIHYTLNGTTPTASSATYTAPLVINTTETLKAIAVKSGLTTSAVASTAYTIVVATPVITPAAGTYSATQSVKITDATSGATIRYTTDGSTPTATSAIYSAAISVSTSKTIKAAAFKTGLTTSAVASNTYTIAPAVATPVLSQAAGNYIDSVSLTLTDATSGAAIHYTLDGSTPTASSPLYSTALTIKTTTMVKAIAIKTGLTNSAIASAGYTIVPSASITTLTSGTAVGSLSGTTGSQKFFKLVVPSGKAKLTLTISGGTGDANLYLRSALLPSTGTYGSRSIVVGNTDTITLTSPAAGTYYFLLYGQAAFSGVTIKATLS